jgi:putative transposase
LQAAACNGDIKEAGNLYFRAVLDRGQGQLTDFLEITLVRLGGGRSATPNQKWLTDITEFQIPAGKVYLSPLIDCFDGLVVSWTIGTRPDSELVTTMLDATIGTVISSDRKPVIHSDRGAHYRWPGWLLRMHNAKLTRSVSRKGCSPDNAACEGFFERLKDEMFYPGDWKATTIEQFIKAVHDYIIWYNEKRIKISLGSLSPIEYRESLGLIS